MQETQAKQQVGSSDKDDTEIAMADKVGCVFVHGWAMNSSVWDPVIEQLPAWLDVILLDLLGHGSMNDVELASLDDIARTCAALSQRPLLWVGWSLGGQAILQLCQRYPEKVAAAMLVATNPCFVQKPGWQSAVRAEVFDQFASDLADDLASGQDKTLKRFLALQVKGQEGAMATVRRLQASMRQRGAASAQALQQGLDLLKTSDMRAHLETMQPPLHWALGEADTLVPAGLAGVLAERYSQHNSLIYPRAGHAPFLTDTDGFVAQLVSIAQGLRRPSAAGRQR